MGKQGKSFRRIDDYQAWDCYNAGMTDKEIAECCEVSFTQAQNWRRRNKLRSNAARKQEKELSPLAQDRIEADRAGMTYGKWRAAQYNGGGK